LSTSAVAVCCSRASLSSHCACARRHSRSVVDSCAIAAVPSHLPSFDAAPRGTIEILRDARKRLNVSDPLQPKVLLLCGVGPGNSILLRADEMIEYAAGARIS